MSDPGKLTARQQRAIAALMTAPTAAAAAKKAGVSEATLRRWRADPGFAAAFSEARAGLVDAAVGSLQRAAGEGIKALLAIAKDKKAPHTARVSAARALIEHTWRGTEMTTLQARIKQIEDAIAAGEKEA